MSLPHDQGWHALNRWLLELPGLCAEEAARYKVLELYGSLAARRCTLVRVLDGWAVYVPRNLRV